MVKRRMRGTRRAITFRASVNEDFKRGKFSPVSSRELELFGENEFQLHRSREIPIQNNLKRKFKKGNYNREKAIKLWTFWSDDASRRYKQQFGVGFTPAERRGVAISKEREYFRTLKEEN